MGTGGRPTLAALVDLEVQLRADAELEPEELHERDGAIGSRIDASSLEDRAATLRWLAEVRGAEGPGARAERRRHQVSAALCALGFIIGFFSVGGWLATASREPVNVVYFWPVFVGSQILLALGFWLAIIPSRFLSRAPLLEAIHSGLRSMAGAIPQLIGRAIARFSRSASDTSRPLGERWGDTLSELRRLDWLYGRLRFWLLVQMTQLFAVAFNVGALAAFVVLPTIDDPAFGWRSRLLDERQVETATAILSTPWRPVWPEAVPSSHVISVTRYSSVAERYSAHSDDEEQDSPDSPLPWAAWWPFLLASVAFYGLAPRLLYLLLAGAGIRRSISGLSFDRIEIRRLCDRLRFPVLATAGVGEEASGAWPETGPAQPAATWPAPSRALALRWAGVDLNESDLGASLAERFGAEVAGFHAVGDLNREGDVAALSAVAAARSEEGIYFIVEAWEPPVGDHVDLLDEIREQGGPNRSVLVVLHSRGADGQPRSPEARHQRIWERAMARRGDPHLFVAALVADENGGAE